MKSADHYTRDRIKEKIIPQQIFQFLFSGGSILLVYSSFSVWSEYFFLLEHSHYLQYYKKTTNTKHYLLHTLRTN